MNKAELLEQYYLSEDAETRVALAAHINMLTLEEYGAGFEGTSELASNLKAATPGEKGIKRKVRPPVTEDSTPTNAMGSGHIAGGGINGSDDVRVHHRRKHKKHRSKSLSREREKLAELDIALAMLRRK